MKAASFDYARPRDLGEAIQLLSGESTETKAMAGGQSLGPLLNMRLIQPGLIVDIAGLDELKRAQIEGDHLVLGACITHSDIEDGRVPDVTHGALPGVARNIAYRAIRNRGTVGGSLCAADPSADWLTALAALGAEAIVRGAKGQRKIPVNVFVTGALETALESGELLEAVRVPVLSRQARWGYYKASRKIGQHARAIGAVLLDPARNVFRAVIGSGQFKPIVLTDARELFGGRYGLNDFDAGAADSLLVSSGVQDILDRQTYRAVLSRAIFQARTA